MFKALTVMGAAVICVGCDARIQHGLDERQANELQTVLIERGFEARKLMEPGKKPTWSIEVDDEQAADAVRVLAEMGLPRPKSEGFNDIFGKGSLVPTPTEERALYLQALSGEVSRTLESVEGVMGARVHLVLPPPARPGQPVVPAKASAFLRVRPGAGERINQAKEDLKALIAGGVDGLSASSVTLVVNEVSTAVPVPERGMSATRRLRILVATLGVSLSVLALLMVLLTLRLRHYRNKSLARPTAPAAQNKPPVTAPIAKRAA